MTGPMTAGPAAAAIREFQDVFAAVQREIAKVVVGHEDAIETILTAFFAGGHVLIEGVPGIGKTLIVRSLGEALNLSFNRIQFTVDLMPADITGTRVINEAEGRREFLFVPGPVFANILLADEVNRATPKTQSALLEAMAEQQVTVDGETRVLPDPFLLLATENPIEYEGTFPLPEAQLDRFFLRTALGYPGADDERRILAEQRAGHPLRLLEPVLTVEDVQVLKRAAQGVYVDALIQEWIVDLVRVTRDHEMVAIGASVRGSLALERAARGWALLNDRAFVVPEDVERLFGPVLLHRIVFRPSFLAEARRDGWPVAAERFKTSCLAAAPKPEADLDGSVVPLEH